MTDEQVIQAAYERQLDLTFETFFLNQMDKGLEPGAELFKTGIADLRAVRDRALQVIKEVD